MIIETKKISELKPAPYNPRKSSEEQEENLKKSLSKFGLVEPIIFNKQTGHIVGGHFRVRELEKLGKKDAECVIVDLSPEDEKELNIRLNANTGDWDLELLENWDVDELNEWGIDLDFNVEDTANDIGSDIAMEYKIEVSVENEKEQEMLYNDLKNKGYECRILTL